MQNILQRLYFVLVVGVLFTPFFFWPSLYMSFGGAKMVLFLFLAQVLLVLWGHFALQTDELTKLRNNPIVLSLVVFLIIQTISSLLGVDPLHSFVGDVARNSSLLLNFHLFLFFVAVVFLLRHSPKWVDHSIKILVVVASLLSIHAILEAVGLVSSFTPSARSASLIGNPIFLASFLVIPFFLSLGMLRVEQKGARYLALASTFIIAGGILASGTRGALVGLVAGLVIYLAQHFSTKQKISKATLTKIGIGIVLVVTTLGLGAQLGVLGPLEGFTREDDANIDSRLTYWDLGLKGGLDHPFLGIGNENYYVVANKYYQAEQYAFNDTWPDKPHNVLVEILVSNGILGVLAFLVLIGFAFKHAWEDRGLLAPALVAFVVQNLFVFDTVSASIGFFLLLALIALKVPSQDGGVSKNHSIMQGLLVMIAIILFLTVTVPFYRLLHAMGTGDIENTTQELQSSPLIHDYGNLAVLYQKHLATHPFNEDVFAQGEKYFNRVHKDHPQQAIFLFYYAQMHINRAIEFGEPVSESARRAVQKVIDLAPGRLEGWNQSILIKQLDGDIQSALMEAQELHERVPDDPETAWILSQLYMTDGQIENAVDLGIKALNSGTQFGNPEGFLWLIEGLASMERYDDLVVVYEIAVEMFPDELKFNFGLAATYAEVGDIQQAIQTAQKIIELDSEHEVNAQAFIDSLGGE